MTHTTNTAAIHAELRDDLAYIWSIDNNDTANMQIVLRAHKHAFDTEAASAQLEFAKSDADTAAFDGITLLDPSDSVEHYNTQTIANGRTLKAAADAAAADFMATLDAATRAELAGYESEGKESFEFIEAAAGAVYAEYQLEADQTMSQFADYSIFNVCREAGHKPVRDGRYTDGYLTAHVTAYYREQRTKAFQRQAAKRLKDRQYHDIADICLNRVGKRLAISRQAMAHSKAKAQAFKAATSHLPNAKAQRVRRYMALDTAKQDIDNAAQAVITADEAVAGAFEILCSLREAELDR